MSLIVLPPDTATARTLGIPIKEADVHNAVAALRDGLLPPKAGGTDVLIAHELALAYGRPDLVAASVELAQWRAWRKRRIAPCTAPLPLATALALKTVGGSATVSELEGTNGGTGSRSRVQRSLLTLTELGWVRRRGGSFVLRLNPGDGLQGVSGVEAKLNNWRRAVRQIQSWEAYVDAAWLAFPAGYLKHVPRTPSLRRYGLIGVEDGDARVVRQPRGQRGNGVRHLLIEQYLYGRWLNAVRRRPPSEANKTGRSSVRGRGAAARRAS